MAVWLGENGFGDSIGADNELVLPINSIALVSFFGFVAQQGFTRNEQNLLCDINGVVLDDVGQVGANTKAVSTMGKYRSSIAWYY